MLGALLLTSALPEWPPPSRFILNPERGASIPTATCRAQFNTPCAIEKVHQIVYEVAALLEGAADEAAHAALLAAINDNEFNQPVLFWPVVLNGSGHVLATGAGEPSASYAGPPHVGGFYQDVLHYETRHSSPELGGVFQLRVWDDIQAATAPESDGYFFAMGTDQYHETGAVAVTKAVERVNYVMKVPTVAGDNYVLSAYSDMPVSDHSSSSNCTADRDAMCSITFVRAVLGDVVTDMIKARDPAEVDAIFAAVSNKQYNRFYKGWYTGFYPFIWGMSGLGYAHGANNNFVGSYLNSTARLEVPKLATLHADLAEAGLSGGGYTAYYWNNYAGEEMYLKVSFTVGVRRFGTSYYIGCGYTHETDAVENPVPGPHGQPCQIGTNQPCAFTNVLKLVGHIQTLCFMANMYLLGTAFEMSSHDERYFYAQPDGFSSAYRNYGFIYDYNQTCVAHGANAALIGRRLEDIISGIERFDGILNGTQLHYDFVEAAEAGGAWVAYNWINAGDAEPYLKLAYLVKIYRDGHEFYLGVGLSDVPLVGYDLPCSPLFSGPCAEDWALSTAGFRMSSILKSSTHEELQLQLASPHESTAPVSAGGSLFGFRTTVFTDSEGDIAGTVLAGDSAGTATAEWLLAAGLSSDSFAEEAPEGVWLGPWSMRTNFSEPRYGPHYVYHITIGIMDEVADGERDGVFATYHVIVPVKVGEMPPLFNESSGCAAVSCESAGSIGGATYTPDTMDCVAPVSYDTRYAGSSLQLCECKKTVEELDGTLVQFVPRWTAVDVQNYDNFTGVERNLQTTHELSCELSAVQLAQCSPGWVLKGTICIKCEAGKYERAHAICEDVASSKYIPFAGTPEGGAIFDCPNGRKVQQVVPDDEKPVVQLRQGGSNRSDCTCIAGLYQTDPEACEPCPSNADCSGDSFRPIARPGYGLLSDSSLNFYPCRGEGRCGGRSEECDCIGGVHFLLPGAETPPRTGTNQTRCAQGYLEGSPLCALCDVDAGYALQLGQCNYCPMWQGLYFALGLCAVLFWFPIVGTASDRMESLEIFFNFVQFLGVYGNFAIEWRPWLMSFFQACAFFNIDLDMMHISCYRQMTYSQMWYIMTFLPVLWPTLFAIDLAMDYLLSIVAYRRMAPARVLMHWGWRPRRDFSATSIRDTYLPTFLLWLHMYYLTGCAMTLKMFNCAGEPGEKYLMASPDIRCWEGEHLVLVGWASLAMLIYFPLQLGIYTYVLFWLVPAKGLRNRSVFANFGFIYCRFEDDLWWWELVEYIRKIGLVVLLEFAVEPIMQSILSTFIIGLVLMANVYWRPYVKDYYDYFDMLMSSVQVILLLMGVFVYKRYNDEATQAAIDESLGVESAAGDDTLEYVACLLVALVFAYAGYAFHFDVLTVWRRADAAKLRDARGLHLPTFLDFVAYPDLLSWVRQASPDEVRRFRKLEMILGSGLKVYSTQSAAKRRELYRRMTEVEPQLLGWLLRAEAQGSNGPLGRLITLLAQDAKLAAACEYRTLPELVTKPYHAAPLALWLSEGATHSERALVRGVMHDLASFTAEKHAARPTPSPLLICRQLRRRVKRALQLDRDQDSLPSSRRSKRTSFEEKESSSTGVQQTLHAKLRSATSRMASSLAAHLQRNECENMIIDCMSQINCEAVVLVPAPTLGSQDDQLPRLVVHYSTLDGGEIHEEEVRKITDGTDWELELQSPAKMCIETKAPVEVSNALFDERFCTKTGLEAISQLCVPVLIPKDGTNGESAPVTEMRQMNSDKETNLTASDKTVVAVLKALNKKSFAGDSSGLPFKPLDHEEVLLCAERIAQSAQHFRRDYHAQRAATYIQKLLRGRIDRNLHQGRTTEAAAKVPGADVAESGAASASMSAVAAVSAVAAPTPAAPVPTTLSDHRDHDSSQPSPIDESLERLPALAAPAPAAAAAPAPAEAAPPQKARRRRTRQEGQPMTPSKQEVLAQKVQDAEASDEAPAHAIAVRIGVSHV